MHAEQNKGEARNALARAVFINRRGENRDRRFEQQRYRVSGLNLLMAAIVLWHTVYLAGHQALNGHDVALLQFLSPLGWEHVTLPAITSGAAAPNSAQGNSGRYGRCYRVSVRFFPFSETIQKRSK